jgi:hypothetical protein
MQYEWAASCVAALAFGGLSIAACSASGGGDQFGGNEGGEDGAGGDGGSLIITGGSGGQGSGCTDPGCIGSTPQGGCDTGLPLDANDPMDGARAMGLCQISDGTTWGLVTASWVKSDGTPLVGSQLELGRGILTGFGPNVSPQEGGAMLALSSGAARQPTDPGYQSVGGFWKDDFPHGTPPGYPKESPSCPGVITGSPYDSAGLEIVVKTPTDAKSFSFNLDFYTYEFPIYICDQYNDFFVAMLTPQPAGLDDGNISFDTQGNTISVNAGFLEVCHPQNAGGKNFPCTYGPGELTGTGFDEQPNGSAATGWLETAAPIASPGEQITLRFAIWDSGDGVLDSSVLIDNFRFEQSETVTGTYPVPK